MEPERFDLDGLDPKEPFEIDMESLPHFYKHFFLRDGRPIKVELEDILGLYLWGAVRYYEAPTEAGDAHWLLVGEIDGLLVTVPLAPPNSGDPGKCRPIGIFMTGSGLRKKYLEETR